MQGTEPGEVQFLDFEGTRELRYVELFIVGPEWVDILNSIGLSEGPSDLWDALDADVAAEQLGATKVIKNGPHYWMADKTRLRFGVEEITIQGIGFRWAARVPAAVAAKGMEQTPSYYVAEANKAGIFRYLAGKPAYQLVSPDGDVFTMQSSFTEPSDLPRLGELLTPAPGWEYREQAPDEDLVLEPAGAIKVVVDDFKNLYNLSSSA